MKTKTCLALSSFALILPLTACTWVKLTDGGTAVSVVESAPKECKKLGSTTSTTKADIASIDRGSNKVAVELETLARNAAAGMSGDTITPETEVSENGEQRFGIYRCGK